MRRTKRRKVGTFTTPPPTPIITPLQALAQQVSAVPPDVLLRLAVDVRAYVQAHPEAVDTARLLGGTPDDLVWALMAQQLSERLAGYVAPA